MAGLNYVTFNQDHSLLAVATTRGLRIYTTDPFALSNSSHDEDVSLVEQLFSTSLVAMILTPRLLRIVNTKRHSTICELTFHSMVVAVKMNRKRLVVVLEESVFIYDISNMKMLDSTLTPLNTYGICAISPSSENNFLALPHFQKSAPSVHQGGQPPSHVPKSVAKESLSGDVLLYDLTKMEEVAVVSAHQAPLSCIALNNDGTLMATSSEKGTVIRIFSIPDGRKLYQFRRGSMPARIYSMSFNATSTLLCVSSATETIHIFKLSAPHSSHGANDYGNSSSKGISSPPTSPRRASATFDFTSRSKSPSADPEDPSESGPTEASDSSSATRPPRPAGLMSLVRRTSQTVSGSLMSRAAGYLPTSVTEMWEPQRDFAWCRVPRGSSGMPVKSVVAMAGSVPQVMVATNEGDFYVYSIDLDKGGEGTLVRRYEYVDSCTGLET
ncbi:WD40 repeat-like protein [Polychaeton citri CBS 116435]|uniref:WD40 repeat-like protein n=1 Tax=Polychaeton citri CBS 116435 TaxID=1314669 RepID=A0A9P4QB16_9PEZI|nr:WD40 repeat-like protein [Polychaeton citri CBS 116435]